MPVSTKRVYEPPSHGDGFRVLIDGIWPRGIARGRLSELRRRSRTGVVTPVFAARDAEHSNATVLGDVVRRGLG